MGLCILGVKIIHDENGEKSPFIAHEKFRRSLTKEEEKIKFNKEDLEEIDCAFSISYGSYSGLRSEIGNLSDQHGELDPLLMFSDCEGFIGPQAVRSMAKYLDKYGPSIVAEIRQDEIESEMDEFYSSCAKGLFNCIKKTAEVENGYLMFC